MVFFKSSADHLGCVVLAGQLGMKQWGGGSDSDQSRPWSDWDMKRYAAVLTRMLL